MNKVFRIFKKLLIALCLSTVSVVLFPEFSQPLWEWAKSIDGAIGNNVLPGFDTVEGWANIGLLVLVLVGIVYTLWRDRCHDILKAEYAHKTGATHLKQKVYELQDQLYRITSDRDHLQGQLTKLNQEHTMALILAKEHEVRSRYGQEDRESLRELRAKLEILLRDSGHTDGFREAVALLMSNCPSNPEFSGLSAAMSGPTVKGVKNGLGERASLPFEH